MRTLLLLNLTFALAGCASRTSPTDQINPAVKMRYWAIQDANRERISISTPRSAAGPSDRAPVANPKPLTTK